MSRIDDLIKSCGDRIEVKELGEVGTFFGGLTGKSKADFSDGSARYISYVNVFNNPAVNVETDDYVRIASGERQRALRQGDILFTGSSETADDVAVSSVVTKEIREPLYLNSFCIGYRLNDPKIFDPEFAKHLFRSRSVRKQLIRTARGVTRFNVSKALLAQVRIPVPPLEVQREIASVLDRFAELEARVETELGAEVNARRRQYGFYRKSLLTFPEAGEVRWAPMGEVLSMRAGQFISASAIQPTQTAASAHPCYGGNGLRGFVATPSHDGRFLLVGRQGALSGNVRRADGKFYATEHAIVVTPGPDISVDWAFHLLMEMNLNQHVSKGAQPGLAVSTLTGLSIPAPSLEEQERTASVLDTFDALVEGLSLELSAERTARRRQYEYYRDRLLCFEEVVA